MDKKQSVRINKLLSETGYCSRREADKLLLEQRITINNQVAEIGAQVFPEDVVKVDGDFLQDPKKHKPIYIAFNKPVGVVCTTDVKQEKHNIIDFIGHEKRIFPIGRLDKDSEGLILLTNDGNIVNKILRAGNQHDKEYIVTVNKPITSSFINGMAAGVNILGKKVKKCTVENISKYKFRIILTQGLNRQIRRMCESFGYRVTSLVRVRIMNINLDMPVGKWRNLKDYELEELQNSLIGSSKLDNSKSGKSIQSGGKKSGTYKKNKSTKNRADFSKKEKFSKQKSDRTAGRRRKK